MLNAAGPEEKIHQAWKDYRTALLNTVAPETKKALTEILYILLIVLLVTRTFGELAHRLGQALLGELVAGIALGVVVTRFSHLFPALSESRESPLFLGLTQLGIFFLMLYGGVERQAASWLTLTEIAS